MTDEITAVVEVLSGCRAVFALADRNGIGIEVHDHSAIEDIKATLPKAVNSVSFAVTRNATR